jgi:predicted DNA-binding transcriptional regulator AlpA
MRTSSSQKHPLPPLRAKFEITPDTRLLTEKETAEILGIKVCTLQKWRQQGRGPRYYRLGKAVRYGLDDLGEYLSERRTVKN